MKVRVFYIFLTLLTVSCASESEQSENAGKSDSASHGAANAQRGLDSAPYAIELDEQTQQIKLVRTKESLKGADASEIIRVLNQKYSGIKLDLVKFDPQMVTVKIDNATKLTQTMGSAGAEAYLAEVTYSLTELPGIKKVEIDFQEGDHAMPGIYQRQDFADLVESK
jgi:hypothetical protein